MKMIAGTIYRPATKRGIDYVSRALQVAGSSNFVRCICLTKDWWYNQTSPVTWVQFTDQLQNEEPIKNFKLWLSNWFVCITKE